MDSKLTFVPKEKILEMMANNEPFTLVEVLKEDQYNEGHLPAAISIPTDKIGELAPKLLPDKNATVITYCSSFTCAGSTSAARQLKELGYANVLDYKGGKADWKAAGLPLVK